MKKSRIAKLALMGASVTALAATLTTSTYAWYVSNKTANVTKAVGSTASGAADGSISLSTTGVADEFYKTITLDSTTNFNGYVSEGTSEVQLEPVTTTDGVTFYQPTYATATSSWTPGSAVTGKNFYFMFYIKAAAGCTVQPSIKVTNKTTSVPKAIDYSATNAITGSTVVAGQDYTIDAIHALHMSLVPTVSGATGSYTATGASAGTTQLQAVEGGTGVTTALSTAISGYSRVATGGAAAYFTEIMGYAPYTSAVAYSTSGTGATGTTFGNISLQADKPVKLEYRIWLDGGDDQCLNPCVDQNFEFEFSYTITA